MSSSINRGTTTRVDLGARRSAVSMFTAGYSVPTIQQLLKGLINNLRVNYWAVTISTLIIVFIVCLTAHLRFSLELECEPEFESIKRHTRLS